MIARMWSPRKSKGEFKFQWKIYHSIAICLVLFIVFMQFQDNDGRECPTMDIRNVPQAFKYLKGCTVIKGSLIITLITDANLTHTDFAKYSFPELREVTEFMIVYQVYGLTTLRNLFPNLIVIRGEKLFLNYALAIDDVPNLTDIGLVSLISIQRGHIYINRCPVLCFADTIDWDTITHTYGTNVIKLHDNITCPTRKSCRGCRYERCWSRQVCQKFKDDNLYNLMSRIKCHPLCLGGCKNSTAAGCNVCQGISDNGICVEKCPSNKVLIPEYLRCYSPNDCLRHRRLIHKDECVLSCPAGFSTQNYKTNETSISHCYPCPHNCPKYCRPTDIQHLSDAERMKGCTIINGSLLIRISNRVNERDLFRHLSSIEEIYGFLKIFHTSSITSLAFLGNLTKIHGEELDYDKYSLVVYFNKNLVDLWPGSEHKNMTLVKGGMFIHSNYKLCSVKIHQFQNNTIHDHSLDYLPRGEIEPACHPIKLKTSHRVIDIDTVTIRWQEIEGIPPNGTEYIIFYTKDISSNQSQIKINSECYEDIWETQLVLPKDLIREDGYYSYNLTDLQQFTQYAFIVKTYRINDKEDIFNNVESDIQYFRTQADAPYQQNVSTIAKTGTSLTLTWKRRTDEPERHDYFIIDVFYEPDKKEVLDRRDYCVDQLVLDHDHHDHEEMLISDARECCKDERPHKREPSFSMKIGALFYCPIREDATCRNHRYADRFKRQASDVQNWPVPTAKTYFKTVHFLNTKNTHTIAGLQPFSLYIIHFYACNNLTQCGPYTLYSDRTASDSEYDRVFPTAIVPDFSDEVYIEFNEPEKPNGMTVAYDIDLKSESCQNESCTHVSCITRLDHEKAQYRYKVTLESGKYNARVRSVSLAGPGPYSDWLEIEVLHPETSNTVSWYWYVLTIIAATVVLHLVLRWRQNASATRASELLNEPFSDEDILLQDMSHVDRSGYI